jgi:phospholipid/cholesterol/gamma-HCH transport system ATP-binding protein
MDTKLQINNLKKAFGELQVLDGIDMRLGSGENIAVLGRSGIGKSVLIKCIVRLIEPDEGEVIINGESILKPEEKSEIDRIRSSIGFLFQGGALYDSMTVKNNLSFSLRRQGDKLSDSEINDRVEEALSNVGLLDTMDKYPADLSGGMVKRVALARTLVRNPEIILYDEPTTGLDPVTAREITELIIKVQETYHTASVIVTHDLHCAQRTAGEIKLLHDARFHAEGSFDELLNSDDKVVQQFFKDHKASVVD